MNYPKITKIIEIRKEAKDTKTILFKDSVEMIPGQFFMIWIPGVDEIPMSVSYIDKDIKGITFRKIGDATKALYNLKKDDKMGIRGPYGNGFKINGKNLLFVGGGTGIAMITPAVEEATSKKITSTVVLGVKNKDELFFEKRLQKTGAKIFVATDDGSKGDKGFATDLAEKMLNEHKFDSVLTCGPEIMMKKLLEISGKIPFQASLERYMKCGFGICGQCCIGKGLRVCKDGPVFDGETLKDIEEFGKYKRDASGKKIPL
jgi:dihydroorotate dehydrogenase electron transfer subunit